jgi:hypothetical protein
MLWQLEFEFDSKDLAPQAEQRCETLLTAMQGIFDELGLAARAEALFQ